MRSRRGRREGWQEEVVLARESTPADTHHSSRAALPFAGASVSARARAAEPGRSEQPCPPHNGAPAPPFPSCRESERGREKG